MALYPKPKATISFCESILTPRWPTVRKVQPGNSGGGAGRWWNGILASQLTTSRRRWGVCNGEGPAIQEITTEVTPA